MPYRQNLIPSPLGARGVKSAIGLIFKRINFEARVMKLSTNVLWLNIRLFCQIGKIKFPPALPAGGGVKSAIGLIFKMVNFEARVLKLYTHVLGLNIRLFC